MRFSRLIEQLSALSAESPRDLGSDPEIVAAAPLDRAAAGEVSFLERDHRLADCLASSGASALLLPLDPELQARATARGLAWLAVDRPKLAFAELLEILYPRRLPAAGVHPSAVLAGDLQLGEGVHIAAHVVIGVGCRIGPRTVLHPGVVLYNDVSIGADCELHAHAVIQDGSRIGDRVVIHAGAVIGAEGFGFVPGPDGLRRLPQVGRVRLDDDVEVGCGSTIDRAAMGETHIGAGTKIDNLVQIAHGVQVGRRCAISSQVGIAGSAQLGDGVILAGQVGVADSARIGAGAIASSKSGIHGEVAAGAVVSGYPAIPNRLWLRCAAAYNRLPEMARTLRQLSRPD
jgi:UDP-3-O-[3-hydroxymyristoyl] glucosamine N-acyltransferase